MKWNKIKAEKNKIKAEKNKKRLDKRRIAKRLKGPADSQQKFDPTTNLKNI